MTTIRRIRPDDVDSYRDARLRALADAPSAFATTLEEASAFPDEVWADRAHRSRDGSDSAIFLAFDSTGTARGLVASIRNTTDPTTAELISMWVAPETRRSGTGEGLVRRVVEWAAASGYERVELWVTRGNDSAERLYRRLGFDETGDVQSLPSDPCKDELRMRLELAGQTS